MRAPAYAARAPLPLDPVQPLPVPGPMRGLNAVRPVTDLGPEYALRAFNVVVGSGGLVPRPGTAEHATNVGTAPGEVRSAESHGYRDSRRVRLHPALFGA